MQLLQACLQSSEHFLFYFAVTATAIATVRRDTTAAASGTVTTVAVTIAIGQERVTGAVRTPTR